MLTCEGEIIAHLMENGPSRAKDIVDNVRHSRVSVSKKLKEMNTIGLIEKRASESRKATLYAISDCFSTSMSEIE
jgi:predicted transcriptional regulator